MQIRSGYAVKAPEFEAHSSVNTTATETAESDVDKEDMPLYDLPAHKQNV